MKKNSDFFLDIPEQRLLSLSVQFPSIRTTAFHQESLFLDKPFPQHSTVTDDVRILKYKTMKMTTNDVRMVRLVCNSVLHGEIEIHDLLIYLTFLFSDQPSYETSFGRSNLRSELRIHISLTVKNIIFLESCQHMPISVLGRSKRYISNSLYFPSRCKSSSVTTFVVLK